MSKSLGASTIVAFIGRTERGPTDCAITIRNYNHYRHVFGGHVPFGYLSYSVQQFFLHGGRNAVVVRIANSAGRALIRMPAGPDGFLELEARQPGSHEFIRASVDYDGLGGQENSFNLIVQRVSKPGSHLVEDQEIFSHVSVLPDSEHFVGGALTVSRLIRLRGNVPPHRPDATAPMYPGDPVPYVAAATQGSDGVEVTDYDFIGSNRDATGIFALDAVDRFDFLCLPPPPGREHGVTTFLAAERYCERRRALLIWDPPQSWDSLEEASSAARQNPLRSRNALTYFPRVLSQASSAGVRETLPAAGAIAGVLSKKVALGDWRFGEDADPILKVSLSPAVSISRHDAIAMQRLGVNVLVATGLGSAAFRGNVTLSASTGSPGLWGRLDKRRLLWVVLNAVEEAATVLDADDEPAESIRHKLENVLEELRIRQAIQGATPAQAYSVRCDADPSPAGELVARVGFALARPAEFLWYDIVRGEKGCLSRPAPAIEAEQLAG